MQLIIDNLSLIIPLLLVFGLRFYNSHTTKPSLEAKKAIKRTLSPDRSYFICDFFEEMGGSQIQFYGDVTGGEAKPGSTLNHKLGRFTVKELYNNDDNPETPDIVSTDGALDTILLCSIPNFHKAEFSQLLKREQAIVFELKDNDSPLLPIPQTISPHLPMQSQPDYLKLLMLFGLIIIAGAFYLQSHPATLSGFVSDPTPHPTLAPTHSPYVYHAPSIDQKNYVLSLGAILSRYNNESMTSLNSSLNIAGLKPMMKDSWSTTDHDSAVETLNWLMMDGHRSEFDSVYQVLVLGNITTCKDLPDSDPTLCRDRDLKDIHDIAIKVHDGVGDKSLIGWDFGRIINVARFAYSLGYISEDEAWNYMVPAAMTIQQTYDSYEEYGRHYILGRAYWLRDMGGNKTQESILQYLVNPVNKSPWTTLDWQTKLD